MKIIRNTTAIMMSLFFAATALSGCSGTSGHINTNKKIVDLKKTTIDSFTTINLDVDVAGVDIIPEADTFAIEYHIIDQDVGYSIKDGALKLKTEGGKNITINRNENSYIKIYVPEGSEFSDIDYEGNVGNVQIDNITVDDMTISTDVGNTMLSDMTVNKNLSVKTSVGNIEVDLANADCSYKIDAGVAEITINGKDFSGLDVEKEYISENGPQVNLSTSTGNIIFNYQ